PCWDREGGELLLGDAVVKRFPRVSPTQYAVLDAFQRAGWPAEVANPLGDERYRAASERLRDALNKLHRGQAGKARIRFHVRLRGRRVSWEHIPGGSQCPR